MKLYADADALPTIAKELIIKTANRTQVQAIFVANKPIKLPPSPHLQMKVVAQGFDMADNFIVANCQMGDLVITSDIPLADEVLEKGAKVLTPRGEELTPNNIKPKLNARDFMESLRGTGVLDPSQMGGQKPYGDKDKMAFANGLNRLVKPTCPQPKIITDKEIK
ncbi:YaiI/YqxD family protein [Moraxella oblonga]|uniref:YaiI/YqxD family protein n=1 Tax=Moraxella oblonga TaxID=200413 RepID=UPI00082C6C9D|nr:YaiI/YqxD family protein [Moraxella oblonga]